MLHGKVLRSPVPHARIVSIDTSVAEAMPGVVCVLTYRDLADIDQFWGHAIRDRPVIAVDKVRFHGEPVAAVAAESEAEAAAAVQAIMVEYEDLPVVADVLQAIEPDAEQVHEGPLRPGLFHGLGVLPPLEGNTCYRYRIDRGEVEAVFAHADQVVEGEYTFPAIYQYAMETHTVVASVVAGEITVHASCQHPFLVRAELAALFDVPLSKVRVIVPYLGGGFGSKSYTKMEPITVALARKAGRPVRIRNEVFESMVTSRRHGMKARMRTAMTNEGRLLGREVECWFDTGAYADNGPRVTATGGDAAPGPYRFEAYRVDASCVYTNTAPSGSYRAFGATHLQWIGELQIDELSRRCGLDPLAVRQANLCARGEEVRAGGRPLDADIIGDVEKAARAVGWGEPKGPNIGRGVSVGPARRRRPPGLDGRRADGGRRRGDRARRHHRARPGGTHRVRADRRRGALDDARARDRARHRHPLHAVRPLDRREPLDDDRGPRRAARRRGRPDEARRDRRQRRARRRDVPRPVRPALRPRGRRADRPRRGRARGHRLVRRGARSSGRSASAPPRSRSTPRPARCTCARPRRSPTSASRSTRSSSSDRTRAARCRGSATRSSRRWSTRTARS